MIQIGMNFDAGAGGADRYFTGLLAGFEAAGIPFAAAAFGPPSEATPAPAQRAPLGPASRPLLSRGQAVYRWTREAIRRPTPPPRWLVTHFALYALPAIAAARGLPHIVHFHGPWADEAAAEGAQGWRVAAKRALERRVYAGADHFIVLSEAFGELLTRQYGIDRERLSILPGGVDLARFHPAPDRAALRRELGWPEEACIIFAARRIAHRMGLEELIAAFGTVLPRYPNARLILAGRGERLAALQGAAAPLGEAVTFPGFLPEATLPKAFAAADFTFVPSRTLEGFGLVTLESLACGTPVLVTPVGGLPEAVRGLDPGLVLAGNDVTSLADGLERGLRGELPSREACRAYATGYGWESIARRVHAVYERCERRTR